jgi:hypothetical protein
MPEFLEVWKLSGPTLLALDRDRFTVGKSRSNDVVIADDPLASRMHAVLERLTGGWCVQDLGSHNGTLVNGERIWAQRALHAGDEIRIGRTRLVYRTDAVPSTSVTTHAESAPEVTRRENDVLRALCRPILVGDVFTHPATVREIAGELVVTEAAVKKYLGNLYRKFGIPEGVEDRRLLLANDAVRRGAVKLTDLQSRERPDRN